MVYQEEDPTVFDKGKNLIDIDVAMARMDPELLDIAESKTKNKSMQKFYDVYCKLHKKKYDEEFKV